MASKVKLQVLGQRDNNRYFRRADFDAWIDAKTRRAAGEEESK